MLDLLNSGFLVLACLVWWIGGALAVMVAAGRRGYSSGHWLLAGFIFGPVLASLFLMANPARGPVPFFEAGETARKQTEHHLADTSLRKPLQDSI